MTRRLLVVVYAYPPSSLSAAVRWGALTKYLAEMGHSITVVTSDSFGSPSVPDPVQVVRPRSLETAPFTRRRDLNPRVAWAPVATRAARRLLREEAFDCVVTTSPPESAHLVGLLLGGRRPAWIADFRDGWCFEPYTERFRAKTALAVDRWLERRVALTADLTVGVTRPIADDLAERLGTHSRWIPNGWDPAVSAAKESNLPPFEPDGVRLVYTGGLWGEWGRNPEPLFRAIKTVVSDANPSRLKLVYAGTLKPEDRALIDSTGVSDVFEDVGQLDRAEALALQHSADTLVLITSRNSSEATGKLFEYLAAGKPIVALAEGNEAERIVRETNTGVVVPPDDVDAIADALRRAARGDLAREYAPRGVERYSYPHLAEEMVAVIEEAIAVHQSRRSRA
ncbi:MAG TPA: glycosyltransferase family 4 protein [Gaiellaceae bacterium]|nr:glycosyltransferase family 4 protein [Gaiellaceae bacterium]